MKPQIRTFEKLLLAVFLLVLAWAVVVSAVNGWRDYWAAPTPVHAQAPLICPFTSPITLTLAGNTQIVAAPAGALIVCHVSFSTTAAEDIQVRQGSGGCGGATTVVSGVYKTVQSMALDFQTSPLRFTIGNAVCLNQSGGQVLGGLVEWGFLF